VANRKLKVIGSLEVNGVQHGELTTLDDSVYNVDALIVGGHVEEVIEEPVKSVFSNSKEK